MPNGENSLKLVRQMIQTMTIGFSLLFLYISAHLVEDELFKIKDMKSVSSTHIFEGDLWVAGGFRKIRECRYIQPVRAVDENNRSLLVISHSTTAGQNWQGDDLPAPFGPWQVVGGAGHKVKIYQEYQCHSLWNQFDDVFSIDSRQDTIQVKILDKTLLETLKEKL